ncbi:hypothetical protein HYFRA_00012967 [Hymenoscyphus fraxineus]|uniref:Concanavalin A-like lectin/glucanase n=1 Tax=Hymenoscyphus fraxineus TaxID=746836 RepID=A0A9N9PM22_9HELO|nr:hypothetical protein HYFRA_00012967 [Hymenoscyphus fraxineus]
MKLSTLLFALGVSYGLVSARVPLIDRDNDVLHGGDPSTLSDDIPHGGYPMFLNSTRVRAGFGAAPIPAGTTATGESISENWGGLIVSTPPPNEHFISASAQIQVPGIKLPAGAPDGHYATTIWVGIDGTDGTPGLFQAGMALNLYKDSKGTRVESDVWVEWFPDPAIGLDDKNEIDIKPGDWIDVQVVTDSSIERPSTGTIKIENLNTGKKAVRTLHAPRPGLELLGKTVEWIVERLTINGQLSTLPDFGTVRFLNCHALTKGNAGSGSPGRDVYLDNADEIILDQEGTLMTNIVRPANGVEFFVEYKPHKQ